MILAGGFVRYPLMWGVRLVRNSHRSLPLKLLMRLLRVYLGLVRLRHRRSSAAAARLEEHYRLHNREASRRAILARYDVIQASDPRALASRTQLPVYYLTGFWDPVVMWFLVRPWLARNCPGYRGWRLVFSAEHNVLGFQPRASARQILKWMGRA
jgi:pimeloyl-ACP methyl ester carboxylesterase